MVIIGIPSHDGLHPLFVQSMKNAIRNVEAVEVYRFNMNTCVARNEIVEVAINTGASHVLFLDTDMIFPEDTLSRLLSHNKDIVGGYYHRKVTGFVSNAFDFKPDGNGIFPRFYKKAGVERVAALGTGCLLIKTSVFIEIESPYFNYEPSPDHPRLMTEDIVFCNHAIEHGYEIWLDTTIRCGHIGSFIVTPNDDTETVRIQPVR